MHLFNWFFWVANRDKHIFILSIYLILSKLWVIVFFKTLPTLMEGNCPFLVIQPRMGSAIM